MAQQLDFNAYPMLNKHAFPEDLKTLSLKECETLCEEMRRFLIEACSITGGHIGASLGTTEMCLAILRVFDSPNDKVIYDVGHQAYVHKLLTGRWKWFEKLRSDQGVSGFLRRDESPHDIFGAGHAGTALSAAVGVAEGHAQKGKNCKTIAVVGDGALTNGMVYEAMNQMGKGKKNLIVVINDNEMSIAPNVGCVSEFLSLSMTSPAVARAKVELRNILSRIPSVGDDIVSLLSKCKQGFKSLFGPAFLFENFGFHYWGPLDGHNLELLETTLQRARSLEAPVVIHFLTKKGKGYKPAEGDRETYHGCGPYDVSTGKISKASFPLPFTKVFAQTLTEIAKKDERVCAITAAMPSGTGLKVFEKEVPERFYDVGIAEEHAVTFAGGLATEGMKPVVAIYSTFLQRALDQVVHDICVQNLDVTFCMDRAGCVGEDGETHQGVFDVSYLRMIPNMVSMASKDEVELQRMLATAIQHPGPASVRYPKGSGIGIPLIEGDIPPIEIGKAEIVHFEPESRFGDNPNGSEPTRREFLDGPEAERFVQNLTEPVDLVFLALGSMVRSCVEVSKKLYSSHGLSSIVVNARFIKPLDEHLFLSLAKKAGAIITVEESAKIGGFGSGVLELLEEQGLHGIPVKRLGISDQFIMHASVKIQRARLGLDEDGIARQAISLVQDLGLVATPTAVKPEPQKAASPVRLARQP